MADNGVANTISRQARKTLIGLKPLDFQKLWEALWSVSVHLTASSRSPQLVPGIDVILTLFSQDDCEGSSATDVLTRDVSKPPGTGELNFG